MGTMLGWRCNDCGAGKIYMRGVGLMGHDELEAAEPSDEGALMEKCTRIAEEGCPECGSKGVTLLAGDWD